MAKESINDLLDNSNITQQLKEAYTFMLLSKGYSAEEIKILDDYVFIVRKKELGELEDVDNLEPVDSTPPKVRKKRSLPKNLVCLTSESEAYNKRDHTLYSLNDSEPLPKGRFIWSVISLYQRKFNPTYEEVNHLFNYKLNLPKKTIIDKSSLDSLRPDRQKRFFSYESDILESKDGIQYAVSNQWSIDKMDIIISFARSNGWKVEVNNPTSKVSSLI
jgi:hypothetical protein